MHHAYVGTENEAPLNVKTNYIFVRRENAVRYNGVYTKQGARRGAALGSLCLMRFIFSSWRLSSGFSFFGFRKSAEKEK